MPRKKQQPLKSYLVTMVGLRKKDVEIQATSYTDALSKIHEIGKDNMLKLMTENGAVIYDQVSTDKIWEEDQTDKPLFSIKTDEEGLLIIE